MKKISEKKLEAFTVGAMGMRPLSRKDIEDQKKKEEEAAAAHVFKEFVETFQEAPAPSSKVWVKAGTYDAGSRREDNREKGKLYKPSSKIEEKTAAEKAQEYAKQLAAESKKDAMPLKKKGQEKKKSNLELFKEELRQIQEEREERHKYKHIVAQVAPAQPVVAVAAAPTVASQGSTESGPAAEIRESGSFDTGDPNTTNLYLGNLNPKISEQQLMELFGRYGPLASIKIMWPRSEEEKLRGRNCGFVAYMSRRDAERALKTLNGRYIMGYEMRLGWGKSVPIMNQPIFIPPPLLELTLPPPPSGLPFNAQPPPQELEKLPKMNYKEYTTEEEKENMEMVGSLDKPLNYNQLLKSLQILTKSVVKVFIPTEKNVLNLIHRTIEFVIREGPMFEALIMSREIENPLFSFLFDNESPAHIYYRWKLFSLLQGDTPTEWNEKEFRMFKDGPIWRPPVVNFYTQGMPDDLVVDPEAPEVHKGALSTAQRDRLEDLIRHLTPEKQRIGDVMIFCIEHADAADEICECIAESLANPQTLVTKKIARLYLVSDILHNCTVKVANASFFRTSVGKHLLDIFENLHTFFTNMESRLKAENVKSRVLKVLRAWEDWAVYPKDFLAKLKSIFLGIPIQPPSPPIEEAKEEEDAEDIDGAPLSGDDKDDEDLDGVPLDGAALIKGALLRGLPDAMPLQKDTPTQKSQDISRDMEYNDDIDGVPLDEDIDGIPLEKDTLQDLQDSSAFKLGAASKAGAFIPSKWETVDPEQIEAQAVTTSKWDTLDPPEPPKFYDSNISSEDEEEDNSRDYSEEKRSKLREIEVKTMQYQDELEAGQRELKQGWNITQQVEHYRKKLLKKKKHLEQTQALDSPLSYMHTKETRRSESPVESSKKSRRSKRSPSPSSQVYGSGSSRSSPTRSSRKRSSRSPYASSRNKDVSPTPTPTHSSRSSKLSKRNRSRSLSDSPKRYTERSPYVSKSSKYDSPQLTISKSRRSPTPNYSGGRSKRSPESSSHKLKRSDERDAYSSRSPTRHRGDKHKHKHKH